MNTSVNCLHNDPLITTHMTTPSTVYLAEKFSFVQTIGDVQNKKLLQVIRFVTMYACPHIDVLLLLQKVCQVN